MSTSDTYALFSQAVSELKARDNFRFLRTIEKRDAQYAWMNGKKLLNLSSNDYLGLASDQKLHNEFFSQYSPQNSSNDFGLSASSSRLLTGTTGPHAALEKTLAAHYEREASLVMTSGYHANIGIIPSLLGPQDVVFSDRLNHASLLDGIRLSGAKLHRFRHLDYQHLESLLHKHRAGGKQALIITESVFSMDGDLADLNRLVDLKKKYQAWLYVDEAHAFGVWGKKGLGLCEVSNTISDIDFLLGTFGKALAALGAFLIADQVIIDYLVNKMRSFIYTTALPTIQVTWLNFCIKRLADWQDKREHVLALARQMREALTGAGLATAGESQIIPVIIGENEKTFHAANYLQENGFLLFAIRPPTVPAGTSRLRLSLTAQMNWNDLSTIPRLLTGSLGRTT